MSYFWLHVLNNMTKPSNLLKLNVLTIEIQWPERPSFYIFLMHLHRFV